jgi:hypothetical protein
MKEAFKERFHLVQLAASISIETPNGTTTQLAEESAASSTHWYVGVPVIILFIILSGMRLESLVLRPLLAYCTSPRG